MTALSIFSIVLWSGVAIFSLAWQRMIRDVLRLRKKYPHLDYMNAKDLERAGKPCNCSECTSF